jgi:hypothetical protein
MFRNRVFFSREKPEPIIVTWPMKNGVFDYSGQVESIIINPVRFYERIKNHFNGYVKELRNGTDPLKHAFENAVAIKWGLGEPDSAIGMNEEEFLKT